MLKFVKQIIVAAKLIIFVQNEEEEHQFDYWFSECRIAWRNGYAILFYQRILWLKVATI